MRDHGVWVGFLRCVQESTLHHLTMQPLSLDLWENKGSSAWALVVSAQPTSHLL